MTMPARRRQFLITREGCEPLTFIGIYSDVTTNDDGSYTVTITPDDPSDVRGKL